MFLALVQPPKIIFIHVLHVKSTQKIDSEIKFYLDFNKLNIPRVNGAFSSLIGMVIKKTSILT